VLLGLKVLYGSLVVLCECFVVLLGESAIELRVRLVESLAQRVSEPLWEVAPSGVGGAEVVCSDIG